MESNIWEVFAGSFSFSKSNISSKASLIAPTRSYKFLYSTSSVLLKPLPRLVAPASCWLLKWNNNQSKTKKHSSKPNRFQTSCSENIGEIQRKSLKRIFLEKLPFKRVALGFFAPSASLFDNFLRRSFFRKIYIFLEAF